MFRVLALIAWTRTSSTFWPVIDVAPADEMLPTLKMVDEAFK
jgi:hypothetical protein